MFSTIFAATLVASLAPQALANLFITEPVSSTICTAGTTCNVRWNDDGNSPSLATIGASSVGLYVGSQQVQTLLQDITDSIDVSTASSVQWTPDATVGPNSAVYFIRFTSLSLKDTTNPNFPFEGFSAKFTLNGMTGTFNATVQSEINGATSVPASTGSPSSVGAATTPSGSSGSATPTGSSAPTNTSKVATVTGTSKASGTSTSTKSTGTSTPNGASKLNGGLSIAVVAVVASAVFACAF